MKMKVIAAVVMGFAMSTTIAAPANNTNMVLKDNTDKLSYSIGIDFGKNFKRQGIAINPLVMAKGVQDGLTNGKMLLTEDQMRDVINQFQNDLSTKHKAEFMKKAEENKAKGEAFLNTNKTKPGVVTTASGLQYKIINAGTGEKPSKDDIVTVEYKGHLINGEVFDSTDKTGKPATFKVTQVIPGWTEVLQLMPVGSTWEVYIPASLAYGERNVGEVIGPNETLIFTIHLISAKKSES